MKILLDQGLPRSTLSHLAALGISARHVGDLGLAFATDDEILEVARKEVAIVASLDADFHRILAVSHSRSPSVIRIRIEGLKGNELAKLLNEVLLLAGADLAHGAAVSVTAGRIRVRSLPIG